MPAPTPFSVAKLNSAGGLPSYTATLIADVAAGSNVIVAVTTTSGTIKGVTDTKAQVYAPLGTIGSGTDTLSLFQCMGQAGVSPGSAAMRNGVDKITVVPNAGSASPVNVWAVSAPGTGMIDGSVGTAGFLSATSTSTSITKATGTRGQPNQVLLSFSWNAGGGGSPTWSGAFSSLGAVLSGNSAGFMGGGFDVVTSTGTVTATETIGVSGLWLMAVIALNAPETAGAADKVTVAAGVPQADAAGAADSVIASLTLFESAADAAAAVDAIQVVDTTARAPWVIPAAADSTLTNRAIISQAFGISSGIQVGQQFQLYSGNVALFGGEGRLNANQSFQTTTAPWTGQNGAVLTQSSLNSWGVDLDTHSCLITPNGVTALPQMQSELFAIRPGQRYSAQAHITASVLWAAGVRIKVEWYDNTPTLLGTTTGPITGLSAGVLTALSFPETVPPAGTTQARLYCQVQGTPSAATLFYVDIIYLNMVDVLLQGQIFTITALGSAAGFTNVDFSPAAATVPLYWNSLHQVVGGVPAGKQASPAFIRSRMPRVHAQNILTGAWQHRDIQGVTQPLITWQLNNPDTFTCTISPPRADLMSGGEPILGTWQTALYLEENNEIKFGGIITDQTFNGPQWGITATGFTAYPNGIPYEGPVYKRTNIDGLDVIRYLWNWLQNQPASDLGMRLGTANSGTILGGAIPPPTARTALKGDTYKHAIAIEVRNLQNFTVGMMITIGDEHTKIRNIGDVPAHVKYHGVGPKPGTKGNFLTLSAPVDHFHQDGFIVQTDMKPAPFELDWWNGTDIGQEIASIQQEAVFDLKERHYWNGPDKTDVLHRLEFGIPRIGVRQSDLRFHEGENIIQAAQAHQDGSAFANWVIGIGAGQGSKTLRASAAQAQDRLRRVFIYTDQTVKRPERMAVKARRQLQSRISIDAVTSIVIINHPHAPFGSFAPGDDIPVRLASGWRNTPIWSRILSMSQDPTTDLMTLSLARSDSFTYMAESGQAGTL